jgi:quinol monooxygenase YgiN
MNTVHLSGQLVCGNRDQAALVIKHLPLHLELTRAEDGCVSFEVSPTHEPFVWQVDEQFLDANAFRTHQERVAASEWGRATAGIERRYTIKGM